MMRTIETLKIDLQDKNILAFLSLIRRAEGTFHENGYRYLFGSLSRHEKLFESFERHPNRKTAFFDKKGRQQFTTAAGAYQFLYGTWEPIRTGLGLADFSPLCQDLAAIELIYQVEATDDIKNGKFRLALEKTCKIWASLPGAGYDQPECTIIQATQWYRIAGGKANFSFLVKINIYYHECVSLIIMLIRRTPLIIWYRRIKKIMKRCLSY